MGAVLMKVNLLGFGEDEIICPNEIVEFADYSRADYHTRDRLVQVNDKNYEEKVKVT